jgi:hypothetical protein
MVTVQVPVPLQSPLHPVKILPLSDVAVKVTDVPRSYVALHVTPHTMPAGNEVTLPLPVPLLETAMEGMKGPVLKTPPLVPA